MLCAETLTYCVILLAYLLAYLYIAGQFSIQNFRFPLPDPRVERPAKSLHINYRMSIASSELFERILFTYPLLKRIVSELEPGDFRNLLLSGQVLPISRNKANKFLISLECSCGFNNATGKVFQCIGSFHEPRMLDIEKIESYWFPLTTACNDVCQEWTSRRVPYDLLPVLQNSTFPP